MRTIVYADESKAKGYLFFAAAVPEPARAVLTRSLASLTLPGQHGLHMNAESDRRRRMITDVILRVGEDTGLSVIAFDAGRRGTERARRDWCLQQLVAVLPKWGSEASVVLDRDESQESKDRQTLIQLARQSGSGAAFSYEHRSRREDPLLAIPDALAWCWARGDPWRTRIRPLVEMRALGDNV